MKAKHTLAQLVRRMSLFIGASAGAAALAYCGALSAQTVSDACAVPHFTTQARDLGSVSSRTHNLDCTQRARAAGHFGKVAIDMTADANAARSGMWTSNGEKFAAEAIDLAAKSSAVKGAVDVMAAKFKSNIAAKESGQRLTAASLSVLSAMTKEASTIFCNNAQLCGPRTEKAAAFVAESLKLAAQVPKCVGKLGRYDAACVSALKTALKTSDIALKGFGLQPTDPSWQKWTELVADAVSSSGSLAKAAQGGDVGQYAAAAGDLMELSIKLYTGGYFRDDAKQPTPFQNALEVLGNATSTWLSCASVSLSVKNARPENVPDQTVECVKRLNDYLNQRLAEIMGYSMVLFQASKEQYNAVVIDGARVVMGEVMNRGGWEPVFASLGIPYRDGSVLANDKSLAIRSAIHGIAAKYKVDSSGLAGLHSSWWDGYAGDVLRAAQKTYYPRVADEGNALIGGRRALAQYTTLRFETAASVSLSPLPASTWDTVHHFTVTARATGNPKSVSIEALNAANNVVAVNQLTPSSTPVTASTSWSMDLASSQNWTRLADGKYLLRAVEIDADGKVTRSETQSLAIARTASQPAPAVISASIESSNSSLRPGGTLTVVARVSAATTSAPVLVIRNASGGELARATFQSRLTAAGTLPERWQFQQANVNLVPGSYSLLVRATSGAAAAESAAVAMTAETATPPTGNPGVALGGSMSSASNHTIAVGGKVQMAGHATGNEPVRVQVLFNGQSAADNAVRNASTGAWTYERQINVAGQYSYVVSATSGNTSTRIGQGTVTVSASTPPSTPGADSMAFASETLPDGSYVSPGAVSKSWTLRNTGSTTWTTAYCLRPTGTALGAASVCANTSVPPGASHTFSVTLNVPAAQVTEQSYRQAYRFANATGAAVGSEVWALVRVRAASTPPVSPGPGPSPATPTISSVQPQGTPMVNAVSTFRFIGQRLDGNVRVTVSDCENGKQQLLSATEIDLSCVPRRAGSATASWRANGSATLLTAGTVAIKDPASLGASSLASKVDAFVATWSGRPVDVDKSYGYQCVDLMHQFARDVLGVDGDIARGNAYSIFANTNSSRLRKVVNTPTAVPTKGDIIFWKPAPANGNAGHVAIFVSGDANRFTSFDQNYCSNSGSGVGDCAPRLVAHTYDGVAGWLTTSAQQASQTPPSTPAPIVVNIQAVSANPSSVTVGQAMTFSASVDNPANVQRVELRFPDSGVVEAMTASGAAWTRSRTMSQTGSNRPFQVVVTKKDGQTVTRDGAYSVTSAPVVTPPPNPPTQQPPPPPVVPPSTPPTSGGEVPPAAGCTAGGVKVCGIDGRTYANACTLMKHGVAKARNGPC